MTSQDRDAEPGDDESADAGATAPARRSRIFVLLGWSALGLVVLGIAWIVVTGLIARSQLEDVRHDLTALRTAVVDGDTGRAQRLVTDIRDHTDNAHDLTTGPAWWVGSNVPVLGSPLRTARTLAVEADRVGDDVVPGVVRLATTVRSATGPKLTSVDLTTVAAASPQLHRAAESITDAADTVRGTSGSWVPFISNARDGFARQLTRLEGQLVGADRAVRVLVPMLGERAPQRYFIGFLNEAEARGGGGIPGAYAIATADRGRIAFETFGTDDDLKRVRAQVDLGADFAARYGGSDPQGTIQNSNLSPDFSDAARIWAGMWQAKTGERIDGALAIDPTALSYLLKAAGPVRLADGTVVSHRNVVALTQKTQYTRFPGTTRTVSEKRKKFLTGLADAVSKHLTAADDPVALVKAVSLAATQRRFVVWSRVAGIESEIRTARWAGQLGNSSPAPYSGFVVNNAAGSKLDYYLRRSMTYARTDCRAGGTAVATLRLTNSAPRTGLPAYVTFRADTPPAGARPGDNRVLLTYYADRSAKIKSVTVDGKAVRLIPLPEGNTIAVTTTLELRAGATVTVRVTVAEPRADGPVQVLEQPLVQPIDVDLDGDRCR